MIKVSVVIPSYRAEKTIARTIDSVLTQQNVDVEVLVVEDGVFDGTSDVVSRYGSNVYHVALAKNRGAPAARNIGCATSTRDFIMFLDADDFLEGEILSSLSESLSQSSADVALGIWSKVWENGRIVQFSPIKNESSRDVLVRWLCGRSGPPPCAVMWRRSKLTEIGGWDESLSRNQDGELVMRAMILGLKVCHAWEGSGVYWQHCASRITDRADDVVFQSLVDVYNKLQNLLRHSMDNGLLNAAFNTYIANAALSAFRAGNCRMGNQIVSMWRRELPDVRIVRLIGYKKYLIQIFCFSIGISATAKILNFFRSRPFV